MVRSRRWMLPAVGALALAAAAGATLQHAARAQSSVLAQGSVKLVSPAQPITVAPRGNVAVTVQVPTNATSVSGQIKVGQRGQRPQRRLALEAHQHQALELVRLRHPANRDQIRPDPLDPLIGEVPATDSRSERAGRASSRG